MNLTERVTPLRTWCRRLGWTTLVAAGLLGLLAVLEMLGPLLVPGHAGEAATRLLGLAAPDDGWE